MSVLFRLPLIAASLLSFLPCTLPALDESSTSPSLFLIRVVDQETSRGVPLVELTAASGIRYYTDSAGLVAFQEASLMDRDVWFSVAGHGYFVEPDGFGDRGRVLRTTPGTEAQIIVKRENIAQRLYRITGSGIYADSVLAGRPVPIRQPLLNCGVMGQDGAMFTEYRGRMFWTWGDTGTAGYPLSGNFQTTSAWSDLPGKGGLDPEAGIDLSYFCSGDFVKKMVRVGDNAMYWLSALVVARDAGERGHLVARYDKVLPPMTSVERGWVEFSDDEEVFLPISRDTTGSLVHPGGQAFPVSQPSGPWFYSTVALEYTRVPAAYEKLRDPATWEAFTCLREGEAFTTATANIVDRTSTGSRARFSWKRNSAPVGHNEQEALVKAGLLSPEERWFHFLDVDTGKPFRPHATTIAWNPWRNRWTLIVCEIGGTSVLGEIWYAEADAPEGPWVYARKVLTHDAYSFYNPAQHPELAKDGGRIMFFEGTYTALFSGTEVLTPRYDYNQIMYKMEVDDPRLSLPVAIYRRPDGGLSTVPGKRDGERTVDQRTIAFYAPDRPRKGCVPFSLTDAETTAPGRLTAGISPAGSLFYALPPDEKPAGNEAMVPLFECVESATGSRTWIAGTALPVGWHRAGEPLCYVWKNPVSSPATPELYASGLFPRKQLPFPENFPKANECWNSLLR